MGAPLRRVDLETLRIDWAAVDKLLLHSSDPPSEGASLLPHVKGGPPSEGAPLQQPTSTKNHLESPTGDTERIAACCSSESVKKKGEKTKRLPSQSAVAGRRRLCPGCGSCRSFFCSSCCCVVAAAEAAAGVPEVSLPLTIHIVRHKKEKSAKSSAIPLRLLAPRHVKLYEASEQGLQEVVPLKEQQQQQQQQQQAGNPSKRRKNDEELPSLETATGAAAAAPAAAPAAEGGISGHGVSPWEGREGVCLLLPEPDAVPASRVCWDEIKEVVLLDCTWYQVPGLKRHPAVSSLPRVRLDGGDSVFWRRHKDGSKDMLSSAEALYLLLREVDLRKRASQQMNKEPSFSSSAAAAPAPAPVAAPAAAAAAAGGKIEEDATAAAATSDTQKEQRQQQQQQQHEQQHPVLRCLPPLSAEEEERLWAEYDGRYDNLLFFFALVCKAIQQSRHFRTNIGARLGPPPPGTAGAPLGPSLLPEGSRKSSHSRL